MWHPDKIQIELENAEHPEPVVRIVTPVGTLLLIGTLTFSGKLAYLRGVHVEGLARGELGRRGLNAIAKKALVELDVDQIIIEGGARTTGRRPGRRPKPFRFPRSAEPSDAG